MFTPMKIILILLLIFVLFGRNKISDVMGDFAKGIKSFKKGLEDDDDGEEETRPAMKTIDAQKSKTVAARPAKRKAAGKTSAGRSDKRKV